MDKRGGITIFRAKPFVSLYQKISLENTLGVSEKFFLSKIFMHRRGGGITLLLSKFFVSQDRNEKLTVFQKFSGIEKNFWIRGDTILSRKFYV